MVHLTLRAELPNLLSDAKWSSERLNSSAAERVHGQSLSFIQWRIQGRGPGGPGHPLFLDQAETRRAEKIFSGWPGPPLILRSGSGIVIYQPNSYNTSPMLSLFEVMAGPGHRGMNCNKFYFSKYINSHDSFYWQMFLEPLTLDIFMYIKNTFLRLRPAQKNISWVFLYLGDNYY